MNPRPVKAPGLVWMRRRATFTPYWIARETDRKAGFRPKSVNLSRWADDPIALAKRCDELWAEMLEWRSARPCNPLRFEGTIKSLARIYQSHPESPFRELRKSSRSVYSHYLLRIEREIGQRHVGEISGLDLKRWHQDWSSRGQYLAASKTCRAVLFSIVTFGVEARLPGCAELATALKAANRRLPNPKPRQAVVSAEQVVELRSAAHAAGRPSSALAYALVFETTLRLWDVIGQQQATAGGGSSWHGLRWEDIDAGLVLRFVPTKTSAKTGLAVTFPLSKAPMVMEEMAHWPEDERSGPMIKHEGTGLPYSGSYFREFWHKDRAAAGIASNIWARDLRASGITEGRASGVSTDDAAKVAGHASTKTTSAIYDRAALEAAERFADARAEFRQSSRSQFRTHREQKSCGKGLSVEAGSESAL